MSRRALRIGLIVGLPLSALFLWLAVRKVDLSEVWSTLTDARPGLVVAAVCAMGVVYTLQAERWRRVAAQAAVRWRRYLDMVVSGVAVNNVLPGRVGDLLRARWLGLEARIPGGRALATVVIDRALDLVTLVAFLVVSLPFVTEEEWVDRIVVGGLAGLGLVTVVLLFARRYTRSRERERRQRRGFLRRIARDTAEGLAEPIGASRLAAVAGLSVGAWVAWAAGAWLVARAVGIDLSLLETAFVAAAVNLGVAIPSSPGFVGTYQWLGVASLGLFGVPGEEALAFAILLQAVWYLPTTVVGGVLLIRRASATRRGLRSANGVEGSIGVPGHEAG